MAIRLHPILTRYLHAQPDAGGEGGGGKPMSDAERDAQIQSQLESNARVVSMDEIAERRAAAAANGGDPDEVSAPAPGPSPAPPASSPPPAPPVATTPAPPAPATQSGVIDQQLAAQLVSGQPLRAEQLDSVQIVVDGRTMTFGEARRAASFDGAAQRRLEEANRLLEAARQVQTGAHATAPGASPPVGADGKGPGEQTGDASKDVAATVKRLTDALLVGDEQVVSEILTPIVTGQKSAQLDVQTLATQLTPVVRQQLSAEEASAKFTQDFPDVVGDPYLASVADGHYAAVVKEKPGITFSEALTEAGTRTRDWLASKGAKPATGQGSGATPPTELEQRGQRKESIDNVGGLSTKATVQEPSIPSASDVIAEMAKARGLN